MSAFRIFIDESGNAEPSDFKRSPYFCLSGILINEESSKKLEFQMNRIKLKYFSRADYIIHSTDLRYHLVKNNHLLDKFAKEIGDVINQYCRSEQLKSRHTFI